ncbi:MAG: YceI family protein [Terriglobales bacterium]
MRWTFEPGHTAAQFRARHMMITWVRGSIKDVHGTLEFAPDGRPEDMRVEAVMNAALCWTGEPARDAHLQSPDFLCCERYPEIRFRSTVVERVGANDYRVAGDLTLRGVTRPVWLMARHLGVWRTPWWEDGVDKGPKVRAGFVAGAVINRYDFGMSWNGDLENGGWVVGRKIYLTLDAEAIRED